MWLFLWGKLPSAAFMGMRVQTCTPERCTVRLPYGWRSQNPFQSIYFAAQCAAGELSTGLICTGLLQGQPPMAMLVRHVEAEFLKKASDTLLFTCEDGILAQQTIANAAATGEAQTVRMCSVGRLPDGTEASRVWITWSFKRRSKG